MGQRFISSQTQGAMQCVGGAPESSIALLKFTPASQVCVRAASVEAAEPSQDGDPVEPPVDDDDAAPPLEMEESEDSRPASLFRAPYDGVSDWQPRSASIVTATTIPQ
jgi:hypothetical protein